MQARLSIVKWLNCQNQSMLQHQNPQVRGHCEISADSQAPSPGRPKPRRTWHRVVWVRAIASRGSSRLSSHLDISVYKFYNTHSKRLLYNTIMSSQPLLPATSTVGSVHLHRPTKRIIAVLAPVVLCLAVIGVLLFGDRPPSTSDPLALANYYLKT